MRPDQRSGSVVDVVLCEDVVEVVRGLDVVDVVDSSDSTETGLSP